MEIFRKIYRLLNFSQRRSALILLGLMIIGMVFEILGIGLVIPVIMLFIQEDISTLYPQISPALDLLGNPSREQLTIGVLLGLVVVYLIKVLYLAFLAWLQAGFSFGVGASISQRLFRGYLYQPYAFYLQRNSAELIRNVTVEVNMFVTALSQALIIAAEALVMIGISCLLLSMEPVGTLIVLVVLTVTGWSFHRFTSLGIHRRAGPRQYHDGLRIQHLQQSFSGVKDVKILGREDAFIKLYRTYNGYLAKTGQFMQALQALPRLWLELLAVCGLVLLVVAMLLQGRAMEAIVPILGLFATAAFRLLPSVNRVLSAIQSLSFNLPVVNTLYEETELTRYRTPRAGNGEFAFKRAIQLSDIGFTYPGAATAALEGIRLQIERGASIGIIGSSGSGKSTLVDIILGLLKPAVGQVAVDGRGTETCLRAWQAQIGYVPQSIYLTDDTLERNIAFGLPDRDIDAGAVRRAVRAAQLEDFLETLPRQLDTRVGERGVRLSGGQLQRIGIARALYHDPEVLVLDEATSALDMATEREVMRAVTALHGRKTIIIVAHRLSTVENCDRIIELERGKVVQQGTPEQMISPDRGGTFVLAHPNTA